MPRTWLGVTGGSVLGWGLAPRTRRRCAWPGLLTQRGLARGGGGRAQPPGGRAPGGSGACSGLPSLPPPGRRRHLGLSALLTALFSAGTEGCLRLIAHSLQSPQKGLRVRRRDNGAACTFAFVFICSPRWCLGGEGRCGGSGLGPEPQPLRGHLLGGGHLSAHDLSPGPGISVLLRGPSSCRAFASGSLFCGGGFFPPSQLPPGIGAPGGTEGGLATHLPGERRGPPPAFVSCTR